MLVAVAGCDLVFPPGKGDDTGDDTPGAWSSVSSGLDFSCAIAGDQTLWCWGYNNNGELGDSTQTERDRPVPIAGTSRWQWIATGWYHGCGIQSDQKIYCWGLDNYGALASGTTPTTRTAPTAIVDDSQWSEVA